MADFLSGLMGHVFLTLALIAVAMLQPVPEPEITTAIAVSGEGSVVDPEVMSRAETNIEPATTVREIALPQIEADATSAPRTEPRFLRTGIATNRSTGPVDPLSRARAVVIAEVVDAPAITEAVPLSSEHGFATVTGSRVNLRSGPGATRIGSVFAGDRLRLTGREQGNWIEVVAPLSETPAWIHTSLIER